MKVKELIEKLQQYQDCYIYINRDLNIEDEFIVAKADTDNILLVPIAELGELKSGQEFSFKEI
ncbi:MAG: hypothetical protein SPK43_05620 [Candidatus Onthovivens sp.]|nr:hypothetical protein [Candidatus Onthovivens sp.]